MQALLCDKCGKRIDRPRHLKLANVGIRETTRDERFDLCGLDCLADLVESWLVERAAVADAASLT